MKKRVSLVTAAILAVSAFAGLSQASAATEFGSGCAATTGEPELNLISIKHGTSSPLPVAAPISGVITEWHVNTKFGEYPPEEGEFVSNFYKPTLDVYRPAGAGSYTLVAESLATGPLALNGVSTYTSRIPVQAGDLLGLGGPIVIFCYGTETGGEVAYREKEDMGLGTTKPFSVSTKLQVPVVARVEPDVDGDGYGDETQDQCPQSPLYQTPCPVITLGSHPVVHRKAVTLYVSSSITASVGVTATVKIGKEKTLTLTQPAKVVTAGKLTAFRLKLPKKVRETQARLSRKKALKLRIVAGANNLAGPPSYTVSTVHLRGKR